MATPDVSLHKYQHCSSIMSSVVGYIILMPTFFLIKIIQPAYSPWARVLEIQKTVVYRRSWKGQ
jgi:hypothetical protein